MKITGKDLREFRENRGFTQSEVADFVGVSLRTIQNYEAGGKIPRSKDEILHRLLTFPESRSLKDVTDNIFKEIKRNDTIANSVKVDNYAISKPREIFNTKAGSSYEELPNGKYLLTVPVVPVRAQATYISEHTDAEYISELNKMSFIVDRVGKGKYQAFEVQNDSMNDGTINSIPDGAIVLGRELGKQHWKNKLHTKDFPYWIIVHKNTILCKEIIDQDTEKGTITCHSLNDSPEFQDFTISLSDCHQLFNIIKKQI